MKENIKHIIPDHNKKAESSCPAQKEKYEAPVVESFSSLEIMSAWEDKSSELVF